MEDFKSEKWTLDDGRRAERRVMENKSEDGQCEKVIELHVEDERPLRLQQRVVEKSKPIVFERKIETVDPVTGSVVEQKIESIEPKVQMQLVEHIASANVAAIAAQSVSTNDCHVTREEMIDTIVAAIKAVRDPQMVQSVVSSDFSGKLNSLGLADEVAGRVNSSTMSIKDMLLMGVIGVQVLGLVYFLLFA